MLHASARKAITQFNSVTEKVFPPYIHSTLLSLKQSPQHFCHRNSITGKLSLILFSSFRRNASPLFYFKCSHHFEAIFKITDIFISSEAVFSQPLLNKNVTPAVFCELAFSKVVLKIIQKLFLVQFSVKDSIEKLIGDGSISNGVFWVVSDTHTKKSSPYFLIVSLNLW